MTASADLLVAALRDPAAAARGTPADTARLFRQARAAGLLARLAGLPGAGPWPAPAQATLAAVGRVVRAQHDEIRREVRHLQRALAPLGTPVVLLKGAAYVMAGLPAAAGRVSNDVDILVPKAVLPQAESLLMLAGWLAQPETAYDDRYYRQWMHELPPMQHLQRDTTLDVHHTILPETARLKPDPRLLFAQARPLPGWPGFQVLAPGDMVLHSMTHLFMNDDMSHALRDLSDLDLLLRHFAAQEPSWWSQLTARAQALDLKRPLYWGLRCTHRLLGTPVPAAALDAVQPWGPPPALRALMDAIWRRAIASPDPAAARPGRGAALGALYLRGHWLRMPPLLLARHLGTKALRLHQRSPTAPSR